MLELLLIIVTAAACKFIHYCIGSPIQGEFYTGRIGSAYGKWISDKYNKFEESEHKRVWNNYTDWKNKKDAELNNKLQNLSAEAAKILVSEYLQAVDIVYNEVENNKKINPYSALGACPICFSTWISIIMYTFFIIFTPLKWYWLFLGTPIAVILSRYIKIQ